MTGPELVINRAGIEQLLSGAEAAAHAVNIARSVARRWQENDPRSRSGGHEPPDIGVHGPTIERGAAVATAYTDDPIWHIIEFGSANNGPYRPATRAAQDLGLDFRDER